ncbi:large subunit GTPase 1, partial [Tremellales sp. Uapishka_1]
MPRHKPFSHKQKKAQLKDARAVKRGELTTEEASTAHTTRMASRRVGTIGPSKSLLSGKPQGGDLTTRKLQSKFTTVSADYLERTRNLAFKEVLERPLHGDSAVFPMELVEERDKERLSCPARPRFRVGQTKKEIERNEEGMFEKWLSGVDEVINEWLDGEDEEDIDERDAGELDEEREEVEKWPRGPTWFETNLEVWRQLWRVTESSSIIMLLLDSRCPPLHSPPSLKTYLQSLKPKKEIILVLTKADLVDADALQAWKQWVVGWWGDEDQAVQVVSVTTYETELLYSEKPKHKPDIPKQSLAELIRALQTAHSRLLTRPETSNANWKAAVRSRIDWSILSKHEMVDVVSTANATQEETSNTVDEPVERDPENEPLTIGLVGQPNVGKSSLLNGLLGEQKVRASRTPGKTKHFQTMFWGYKKEIKIVDCPGLVCPSLVGVDLQVLAGILPISQIPSLPACIHFAARHLPLEQIFRIPFPSSYEVPDDYASRKTYRDPNRVTEVVERKKVWTAGGLMEGRAEDRGFVTAKGGRPDTNRAANGIMRQLADGKIRWGFWPPGSEVESRAGKGIWLGDFSHGDAEVGSVGDESSEVEEEPEVGDGKSEDEDEEEEDEEEADEGEDDDEDDFQKKNVGSFFAALDMSDGDEEEEEEEEEE